MDPLTRPVRRTAAGARPLAVLALGVVLVTGACGRANPTPGSSAPAPGTPAPTAPTSTGASPTGSAAPQTAVVGSLRLEATMVREGQVQGGGTAAGRTAGMSVRPGLVVDYRLTNTGSKPVLAYDVVPQDLGSARLPQGTDLQHAWVYEQSGVLRLGKQGFATAPNVRFAAAPVIGAHLLAPGASVTGRAYAVWPLALDVPGDSFSAPRQPVDPGVRRWQLCVQVDGRTGQARPSDIGGVVQVPVAAPQGDELVCTQPAPLPGS